MYSLKRLLTYATLTAALTGCGTPADTDSVHAEGRSSLRADVERQILNELPEEVAEIKRGNIQLSLSLMDEARKPDENQMISAYSIRTAFAQVYAGARGSTASEINEVLHFNLEADDFHTAMNGVDQALATRNLEAEGPLEAVELYTANTFWGSSRVNWRDEYLGLLGRHYGAGIEAIDFGADPEAARAVINQWVEDHTESRIKDLLPRRSIKGTTTAVLTNAVYFKAPWAHKFEADYTHPAPFKLLDGSAIEVDTMNQRTSGDYAAGDGWFAVEKPYRGGDLSMLFIVPDEGNFEDFEATLTHERLTSIVETLEPSQLALSLPKFTFDTTVNLKEPLREMGMSTVFSNASDLSGMTNDLGLKVTDAFHKTFIAVDEGGAEAAAATAIVTGPTTSEPPPATVARIDRPFIFAIRDKETGVFLFYGRVVNPTL